ncbi:hypothetical protein INT48_004981 [Thamnidium elegans]|uniref:Uncharacterized protein n=1 Tax=Thamnidium elegans TaxID=101142 RepID=A0A8H7SW35_9FUNG|nr:hypothetical protein INT48_004981 [Thamnidium elegans]
MVILQDAVARQDGELERVQAKGMIGGVVTAKLDFSKTKGLPECTLDQGRYNGVRTNASGYCDLLVWPS